MHLHIISPKQAKAIGIKFYFNGKPCKNGNLDLRRVATSHCICEACRQDAAEKCRQHYKENRSYHLARSRRYYNENRDHALAYAKAYSAANAEKVRERFARWYQANAERARANARQYRIENLDKRLEYEREYRAKNRDAVLARQARWREANQDHLMRYAEENRETKRASNRRWHQENPHRVRAKASKRRAVVRERIPAWFGEFDEFVFVEAFDLALLREEATGIPWHVDHMVPLISETASGLHCGRNVQVIPGDLNWSKNNRMILTEPDDWLSLLS